MSVNVLTFIGALLIVSCDAFVATGQDLRELAREDARRNGTGVVIQPAPPSEYPEKTIEEIATEADLVLQGRLLRGNSYLSEVADRVLTDYRIVDPQVIAGSMPILPAPAPGVVTSLFLTLRGGEVTFEGLRIRSLPPDRGVIKDGATYILALMPSRNGKPGHYEIYNGAIFEVRDGRVTALIKQADRVFKGTVDSDAIRLTARLRAAKKDR